MSDWIDEILNGKPSEITYSQWLTIEGNIDLTSLTTQMKSDILNRINDFSEIEAEEIITIIYNNRYEKDTSECTKMEDLEIEIFKHFLKVFTYIVWNKKNILGVIIEDDIMKLLDEKQVLDFYHFDKTNFKVRVDKVEKYLSKND